MANTDVKLLGKWQSPFVLRVRIALNIKSVDYEFMEEELAPKSELLLKSNPVHKKIPVFFHHDRPICESLVIVQYIDEVWNSGPSILPSDPYDRAIARFWVAYIEEQLFPSMKVVAMGDGEEAKKAAAEQVVEGFLLLEQTFVKCSAGKDYFAGDKIGFVDIALGSYLAFIKVTEKMNGVKLIDEAKTPNLAKWAVRFCADEAVKDVMPETERLLEFVVMMAKFRASQATN